MQAHIRKKEQANLVLLEAASIASPVIPTISEPESQPDPIHDTPDPPPEPAFSEPESHSEPAPDPTGALAEKNRTLKRRLLEAVTVANGCHRAMKREREKADEEMMRERSKAHEEIKRLKFHLLLENEALTKLRCNPKGVKLGPTPEEAQAFVAEQERIKVEAERRRQKSIEDHLKHELELTHMIEQRNKEQERRRTLNLPQFGPKTKLETEMKEQMHRDARDIALTHGRAYCKVSDLSEAIAKSFRKLCEPQGVAGAPAQCRQDRQQVLRSSTAQDPPAARDARESNLMQSNADNGGHDARSDGKGDGLCGDLC